MGAGSQGREQLREAATTNFDHLLVGDGEHVRVLQGDHDGMLRVRVDAGAGSATGKRQHEQRVALETREGRVDVVVVG